MKIYTRTGDKGKTGLFDGVRVDKDDIRVEAYGTVDELNSALGLARHFIGDDEVLAILLTIQRELFNVAGELATSDSSKFPERISPAQVTRLEEIIDSYIARIEQMDKFIIPGSSKASAALHVARTVCRRAERRIITLSRDIEINEALLKYINRLSDTLYALARFLESELIYVNFQKGAE